MIPPYRTDEEREALAERLLPIASELIVAVRDFGPDAVRGVLVGVDPADADALVVILAAMADPDRSVYDLLGWVVAGPVQSLDGAQRRLGRPRLAVV